MGDDNRRAGDNNTGFLGSLYDSAEFARIVSQGGSGAMRRADEMRRVMRGELTPHPDSRLGAFAATSGYPAGSVGNSVNKAIGTLYLSFGTYGEERIGSVFNSPDAKALYCDSVDSPSSKKIATMEFEYWSEVRGEDPYSQGALIATQFDPDTRDQLQKRVFATARHKEFDESCEPIESVHETLSEGERRKRARHGPRTPRATSGADPGDTHSPLSGEARRRARHGPRRSRFQSDQDAASTGSTKANSGSSPTGASSDDPKFSGPR